MPSPRTERRRLSRLESALADSETAQRSRVSRVTAVRIDGKALAEKVRAQVAEDVRAYGEPVCLATILVGDDPASHTYVGSKHKASHEAGIDSRDHRFPSDTSGVRHPRSDRRAERGRCRRRHSRPAPAARAHGRAERPPRSRSREGRRRLPRPERREALPRRAVPRAGDALGGHGHARGARRSPRRGRRPSSSGGARSSASRWRCSSSPSTRRSPSATRARRISRPHASSGHPRRRRRAPRARDARHGRSPARP